MTLVILIVAFATADMVLARVKPFPVSAHLDVPKAQVYGWAFGPFETIIERNPETGEIYHERANSEGWRDVEHTTQKTLPRLLLLGDSQVFGTGVPFDQTIGRHLQRFLADRCEVIAVGVPGWGTDQELLFLQNEGWSYQPDIVVLLFTAGNDVMNNMYDRAFLGTAPKPTFRLVGDDLELRPLPRLQASALRRLFNRSMICRYIRFRQHRGRFDPGINVSRRDGLPGENPALPVSAFAAEDMENDYSHLSILGETWSDRLTEGWRLTCRLIQEMDHACRAHGAGLVVYPFGQPIGPLPVFPWTHRGKSYRLDLEKPFRLLREFCRREKIAYLDEPLEFRQDDAKGLLRYPREGHLNPTGSRCVAENIALWVKEHDLLRSVRAPIEKGSESVFYNWHFGAEGFGLRQSASGGCRFFGPK